MDDSDGKFDNLNKIGIFLYYILVLNVNKNKVRVLHPVGFIIFLYGNIVSLFIYFSVLTHLSSSGTIEDIKYLYKDLLEEFCLW